MTDELIYQLALSRLYRHSVRKGLVLLRECGSASEAWAHVVDERKGEMLERAKQEQEFILRHDVRTLFCTEEAYPKRLKECPDMPLMLYTKGNVQLDEGKFVSVVGTRAASERGRDLTRRLVLDLARMCPDVTIVSGLAYGVDVAAHRAALEAGIPTLIIPAHGLDRIYPNLHRPVAVQALANGGIVTEYMSGTNADKMNFVARNRIVAGLADAVVVVESRKQGGSLITANMAVDYDRDLFTFPGRPTDVESAGCNDLIRNHQAQLIESAEDLVKAMMWQQDDKPQLKQPELFDSEATLSLSERMIWRKLQEQEEGMHINMVVMETQLQYAEVASAMMSLEMLGYVRALPGGMFRSIK